MEHEGLVTCTTHLSRQIGLLQGRVDVAVAAILKDPEEAVETKIDRTGLDHGWVEGCQEDAAAGLGGPDIAVG